MEVMATLSDAEIAAALERLSGWGREGEEIVKTYDRGSFPAAVAFVVRIGFLAEQADHHPDLDVRWKRVRVALTTHDSGGITQRDVDLASAIDAVEG